MKFFFSFYVYICTCIFIHEDPIITRAPGEGRNPIITGFTMSHVCACPSKDLDFFQHHISGSSLCLMV